MPQPLFALSVEWLLLSLLFGQPPPGTGRAGDPANPATVTATEDFEVGAPDRWVLIGDATIAPTDRSRALTTRGFAFGALRQDNLGDLTVRFRYRHGQGGLGDVGLHVKGLTPPEQLYHVMIADEGIAVVREVKQKPQELARRACPLRLGAWYELAVQIEGGRIQVEVDRQPLISVTDPAPLPAGYIAFGSLSGDGFAFDDMVFTVVPPPPAPGTKSSGRPKTTPPPTAPQDPVPAIGLGVLQAPAVEALGRCGIAHLDELVSRLGTRAALTALSKDAGVPAEHLLFLAQAAELTRITGSGGVACRQVAALQRLDLSRPEDVAAYQKQPKQLQEDLEAAAIALQAPAPDGPTVAQWTQAAAGQATVLRSLRELTTPRQLDNAQLAPQLLWLGDGGGGTMADTAPGGAPPGGGDNAGAGPQVFTIAGIAELPGVTITPGQDLIHEFNANAGGLYRVDYALHRPGGEATYAWSIEKPIEKPQKLQGGQKPTGAKPGSVLDLQTPVLAGGVLGYEITGWAPLVQGGPVLHTDVLNAPSHLAFFWVKSADIGWTGKLRLRLKTVSNTETLAQGDASGIEQGAANDQKAASSPIVRGSLRVSRTNPVSIQFGGSAGLSFYTVRLDPDLSPLRVVQTPRLQRRPSGQNPWGLTVRLDAEPNTYAPYMCDPKTGQLSVHNPGQRHGGQVICNDQPMAGTWQDDAGVRTFSGTDPPSGVYDILVGPWAHSESLQQLSTVGEVLGRFTPDDPKSPTALQQVKVRLELQGGGELPTGALVMEVTEVTSSTQAEEDVFTQDNDEGLGDFRLETAVVISALEADPENRLMGLGGKPLGAVMKYPRDNRHFHMPGVGNALTSFPRAPIGWWPMQEVDQYDQLQLSGRLWEDDDSNNWSVLLQVKDVLFKLVETVWAMWKGDVGGVLGGMKGYVEAILDLAPLGEEDELIGMPCLGTTKASSEWGFVAEDDPKQLSPDEVEFAAVGPNRADCLDSRQQVGAGGHSLGYVSTATGGESQTSVRVRLRRNVPVLFSWAEVQLLDFTVLKDLDAGNDEQQSPMEVYVVGGFGGSGEYRWNPWFRRDLLGDEDESLGYNLKFWDWDVKAGQKVAVSTPAPPPTKQEGGMLLPLFHQGPLPATPYTYTEIGLWDGDPGQDEFIGIFSRMFYHDEMRRLATDPATRNKWIFSGTQTLKPSKVRYSKEGPFYTAEIIAHNTGNWLDEIHVKVWLHIWEG